MTTKEQREIIEAYERGEEIEWKSKHCNAKGFIVTDCNYEFDFQSNYYRIKPKRWRADTVCNYYSITGFGEIRQLTEINCDADAQLYKLGNYFRTREEAEKARELIKECLTKFHEENE